MKASDVVRIARSQRGYREGPRANQNKYSPAVPGLEWSNYQPWCATFTCWVFLQAGGRPGQDFPLTASCLQQVAWGRSKGRFYSSPKVGDLVLFGPGGGTHVEIVVAVSGGYFTSVGGNTSGSWAGNYANGDGVYEKRRAISSAYGFVRPVYNNVSGGGGSTNTGDDDMVGLAQGMKGERVKYLQELLVAAGFSVGSAGIDGDYGPATAKAVLAARKSQGSKQKFGDKVTGAAAKQIMQAFVKKQAK